MYSCSGVFFFFSLSASLSQPSALPSAANASAAMRAQALISSRTGGPGGGRAGGGGTAASWLPPSDGSPLDSVLPPPTLLLGQLPPASATPAEGCGCDAARTAAAAAAGSTTCTEKGVRGSGWPRQVMWRRQ